MLTVLRPQFKVFHAITWGLTMFKKRFIMNLWSDVRLYQYNALILKTTVIKSTPWSNCGTGAGSIIFYFYTVLFLHFTYILLAVIERKHRFNWYREEANWFFCILEAKTMLAVDCSIIFNLVWCEIHYNIHTAGDEICCERKVNTHHSLECYAFKISPNSFPARWWSWMCGCILV